MTAKARVLVDANVVLDVLAKREPYYASSAAVWALVESGDVQGLIAAHTVTTLHYLVAKYLHRKQATLVITKLLHVFEVAEVGQGVLFEALALGWEDFEDAVQAVCLGGFTAVHEHLAYDRGAFWCGQLTGRIADFQGGDAGRRCPAVTRQLP